MTGADVESGKLDYLNFAPPPSRPEPVTSKVVKELKRNWWLWSSVGFVVALLTGLFIFRDELYSSAGHGLPFLAIKENAAEACASQCTAAAAAAATPGEEAKPSKLADEYSSCYAKCVAQESKEVAEEREKFKENEEKFEKAVGESEEKKTIEREDTPKKDETAKTARK